MEIRISVRTLVEFMLRSGSIDNRKKAVSDNAMAEGGRIHRMIQRRMGAEYQAEVTLSYRYPTGQYDLLVEGRADGIITSASGSVTVDEIKGTYRDLDKMKEPVQVHLAQAKCYAYMYSVRQGLTDIRVRMTYCNMDTEEIRYFEEAFTKAELEAWFLELVQGYQKWSDEEFSWKEKRQKSIKKLQFPFPYREGQKELASYVYQTICHEKKLFIEAPTGVGKTISTVFPAIKALGEEKADRIFYLTAKTITRTVADDTFQLLREKGLQFKTVILTAKEKICFREEVDCNPVSCPYANGHYDRINDAMYELLTHETHYSREKIEEYADKFRVCPFEMCLDMSLFADGIICDYNYLFDPHVYLRRFFTEGVKGNYLFLVDEAHNLVERGREMYSAVLKKEDFLALKKTVKPYDVKMEKQLEKCNHELLLLKRHCESVQIEEGIEPFVLALRRLSGTMEQYLEDHDDGPVRKEVLEFYFEISHFLGIYERLDDNYVIYTQLESDGGFILKLFCVNPSVNLAECMMRGKSSILFSATLLPIQYYKGLLGGDAADYEVYARSTFQPEKKALFLANDVTSKYTRRTELEYHRIAGYIHEIVKNRHGNYMAFFPSHAFLQKVYEIYSAFYGEDSQVECIVQEDYMNEADREQFLRHFTGNGDCEFSGLIQMDVELEEEKSLLGFCVLGGIFSEGIDLKRDSLIGAIIVGTGLPQVCPEREILKNYFDERDGNGFNYAYRFPGMNKVLQAAGRVIRTAEDVGLVALLDERFMQPAYRRLFPREWESYEVVEQGTVAKRVERFWNEWL